MCDPFQYKRWRTSRIVYMQIHRTKPERPSCILVRSSVHAIYGTETKYEIHRELTDRLRFHILNKYISVSTGP